MIEQEYEFKEIPNQRFIDYILLKAISDIKTFDKTKQKEFFNEYSRRCKDKIQNTVVFQINGFDLPAVEVFEILKENFEEEIRIKALELINEKIADKMDILNKMVGDFERVAKSKIFGEE